MVKRNAHKNNSRSLGLALIVGGTILVALSTAHNILRLRSLRLDKQTINAQLQSHPLSMESDKEKYPSHIFIQWFVDVNIEPGAFVDNHVTISSDNATFLLGSGKVGEKGNLIIFGHNKRSILGNIRALKGNEKIVLTLNNGSTKTYQIKSLQEVDPSETQLLQPTPDEVLTIYTCSGLMDSKRFVVRAIPFSESNQAVSF